MDFVPQSCKMPGSAGTDVQERLSSWICVPGQLGDPYKEQREAPVIFVMLNAF